MRHFARNSFWIAVLCVFAISASSRGDESANAGGNAYFETHIRPLLIRKCYSCHSHDSGTREGGLSLESRAGWSEGGERGPAIIPGDADASLLIQAVRYADTDLEMPPDKALSKKDVERLEAWVRMGAPDPRDAVVSKIRRSNPLDRKAGRSHWAFRPLTQRNPPTVRKTRWANSTIDLFVLARLEAANLPPAPDVDRRGLARRIFVQLAGLPPTPGQMSAFLADSRDDAVEHLVDELLNSPQFGERWGRHWLDLARYADSNGLDENFLFREAWRYRNGIVDAINADTPFDRFILEQIAGDLLPYDSTEQRDRQRIAAGFLVLGPKVLLGNNETNQRMEVADEQLDTIGRAILGQTLGCARCHDHKFDPIPTADYYAMAGILTSTDVMERRHMLGQQRRMERLVGLGAGGEQADGAYEQYWRDRPKLQARLKKARAALKLLVQGDTQSLETLSKDYANDLAEGAQDERLPLEVKGEAQKAFVKELEIAFNQPPPIPPRAMTPCDRESPADEAIRLAGQFDRPGETVPRGFLRVLEVSPAVIPEGRSGRIELARWLTDVDDGAGRLAARVLANRIWHHLIGRGIVRTTDNFGRTGEAPSHPDLLDHLARRLIASQWSMKNLIREIVLSRTFAMSSHHDFAGHTIDPDNRLLWRAHRRRLEPEVLRDAMLLCAQQLDLMPMDSSVAYLGDQATAVGDNKVRRRTDFPCRSVYLPVIRNDLPELFDVFDFADPHATTGTRSQTIVATQGLFILNDESVMAAAEATAKRLIESTGTSSEDELIDRLFELVLSEPAANEDRVALRAFVGDLQGRLSDAGSGDPRLTAWSMAVHALFASSRFQILE